MESLPPKPDSSPKHRATVESLDSETDGDQKIESSFSVSEFDDVNSEEAFLQRIILQHAGYDTSKLKDGEPLDEEAEKLLRAKTTQKRLIFQHWPRDPKGGPLTRDNTVPGKTTPNSGEIWGATLFDLYYVSRHPDLHGSGTISSGSKLANWMKKYGELEAAAHQISWAEREADPKQIPPFDIAELISCFDMRIMMGVEGKQLPGECESKGKQSPQSLIRMSVFDPASYPKPWPLIPFSYEPPPLQALLPYRLLPKKLIVHDPWDLLTVDPENSSPMIMDERLPPLDGSGQWTTEVWSSMADITHEYHLSLSPQGLARIEEEEDNKKQAQSEKLTGFMMVPQESTAGPIEPPIFVHLPPKPSVESIPEGHLYLSPEFVAGKGNHSVVYHAEWEVPRSMLMQPKLCMKCVLEDVQAILKEKSIKDRSRMFPDWKDFNTHTTNETFVNRRPDGITEEMMGNANQAGDEKTKKPTQCKTRNGAIVLKMEGPPRRIDSRVQWQVPNDPSEVQHCSHESHLYVTHPRTTKVRVLAKLSIEGDRHLLREAVNYQKFPKHFFEHWSGYSVVAPVNQPTPVGAIVPQFYGIYRPAERDADAPYLSPIMLLENCGVPVEPDHLNVDDKNECASLYYRFHLSGWMHGSVAARNIVMQFGPISEAPFMRAVLNNRDLRQGICPRLDFRLIDFGRSHKYEHWDDREAERMRIGHLVDEFNFLRGCLGL